jgi:hypothetical protein
MATQFKRQTMYYKIKELFEKKYKVTQISRETGKDPKTVRKYLRMSEETFQQMLLRLQHRQKKLKPYEPFIKERLEGCPDCSAAQIDDWLKENYPDIFKVASMSENDIIFLNFKVAADNINRLNNFHMGSKHRLILGSSL